MQRYKPGYRAPPPPLDLRQVLLRPQCIKSQLVMHINIESFNCMSCSDSIAPGPRILVFTQAILQQQALLEPEPVEQPQTDEVLTQTKRCCGTFILVSFK